MDDPVEQESLPSSRLDRVWFYLEWIPISLIALGVLLRQQGSDLWQYALVGGGVAAIGIYLLFSTSLLRAQRSSRLEMTLSVVSGLLLSVGIASLVGQFYGWALADQGVRFTILGGFAMVLIVGLSFLLQIKNTQSSRFYRNLLARLLVFVALMYTLGF